MNGKEGMLSQTGSTTFLVVGVILVVFMLLLAALATAEVAVERVRQQTSADLGALAGANVLAKSAQTNSLIDFTVWARNTTLDTLYMGALIVSIASAGSGASAFKIPLDFQKATIGPVKKLEAAKTTIDKAALVYTIANSAVIIKDNDSRNTGLAVPMPLYSSFVGLSQEESDIINLIKVYDRRREIADNQMQKTINAYTRKKAELAKTGKSESQIMDDPQVKEVLKQVRQTTGRVGGITKQRNLQRKRLESQRGKKGMVFDQNSVVAIVYHPSTKLPFTGVFGGLKTGKNVAIAAARVSEGPMTATIGKEALENILSQAGVPAAGADGLNWLLESINIVGHRLRLLKKDYGPIGGLLNKALDELNLIPPSISEKRPALTSVESVIEEGSDIYKLTKEAVSRAKSIEVMLGKKILPEEL